MSPVGVQRAGVHEDGRPGRRTPAAVSQSAVAPGEACKASTIAGDTAVIEGTAARPTVSAAAGGCHVPAARTGTTAPAEAAGSTVAAHAAGRIHAGLTGTAAAAPAAESTVAAVARVGRVIGLARRLGTAAPRSVRAICRPSHAAVNFATLGTAKSTAAAAAGVGIPKTRTAALAQNAAAAGTGSLRVRAAGRVETAAAAAADTVGIIDRTPSAADRGDVDERNVEDIRGRAGLVHEDSRAGTEPTASAVVSGAALREGVLNREVGEEHGAGVHEKHARPGTRSGGRSAIDEGLRTTIDHDIPGAELDRREWARQVDRARGSA
jgi:hypothetical protein